MLGVSGMVFGIVGGGMEHCPGLHPGIAEMQSTVTTELALYMQTLPIKED